MNNEEIEYATTLFLEIHDPSPVVNAGQWQNIANALQQRLRHPVQLVPASSEHERQQFYLQEVRNCLPQRSHRFVILSTGSAVVQPAYFEPVMSWVRSESTTLNYGSVAIHLADPWTVHDCFRILSDLDETAGVAFETLSKSILHVLIDKVLGALRTRSIDSYFQRDDATKTCKWTSDSDMLRMLDLRIDDMLPSEYQGRTESVSPNSMGSASLKRDSLGRVAWDEIWTSFCDLAMAGGPPHRGKLLEAVTSEEVNRDFERYVQAANEIRRGIEMVTELKTIESQAVGWIGIECDNEAMAVWLMRAILVENVMVRREKQVLYLPAGPEFTVQREIKNVITSVAKTVHYWRAHLRTQEQR
jgi:hypothetical protein